MENIYDYLTVILPIRDNHEMTVRWLNYAVKVGVKFKIVIADGSKIAFLLDENFKKNLRIRLIHTGFDRDGSAFVKKLAYTVNEVVDTKFCLIADNDDFFLFEEVEKHVQFLIDNKDYAASCGSIMKFELSEIYSGQPKFTHLAELRSFDQSVPLDRILSIMDRTNYREIFYDVMYTRTLGEALADFLKLNDNNINHRFLEFYIATKVLSTGKANSVKSVFLLRQEDYQSSTSKSVGLIDSIFLDNWSSVYTNLVSYAQSLYLVDGDEKYHNGRIQDCFKKLFEAHISEKFVKSGDVHISFVMYLRSKYKRTRYFSAVKYIKSFIQHKKFLMTHVSLIRKLMRNVFL